MSDKVRKPVYLRKKQVQALQKRAKASGLSESELIRRAVDDILIGARMTIRPDPSALEKIEAFIETLKKEKPKGQPIQVERDEIYNSQTDMLKTEF